jgi:hypothetical protein
MKARRVPVVSVSWMGLLHGFLGTRSEVALLVDFCRVFSAEDALRWALSAYNEAVRSLRTPEGPWVDADGLPWSTPDGFREVFLSGFEARLWEGCERSPRWREVERWKDSEPVFCALRERELPRCGSVDGAAPVVGVPDAT